MSASDRKVHADDARLPLGFDGFFPLTEAELLVEWKCEYETNLGRICGASQPTKVQDIQARDEADKHDEALRKL